MPGSANYLICRVLVVENFKRIVVLIKRFYLREKIYIF